MIVETHIHLNHEQYDVDLDEVVARAKDAGVGFMVDIGCEPHSIERSIEIANKYEGVKSSIGLHPVDVSESSDELLFKIEKLAEGNKEVIAIGEIGLDYHWYPEQAEEQKELLHKQMQIAERLKLPVVIHSRDAYDDCYEILSQYPNVTGVIHSFSDNYAMAEKFINIGYMIGIGGPVTFKNGHNQKEVVSKIDLTKLVVETDGPYLTPTPYRGKRNEPSYIPYIIDEISKVREQNKKEVEEQLYNNSLHLFKGLINE